jgi:type II secretory ATPase GspE/PulE/Tfp pilus assembly ATPase PilB-like protein
MNSYKFNLTPGYCLYNKVAIMSQKGSSICFITENPDDELLKSRIKKAFSNYLAYIVQRPDCPAEYKEAPSVEFIKGSRTELKKCVSQLFLQADDQNNKTPETALDTAGYNDAAAVLLLDTIMNEARSRNATDIHIEKNTVKFRIYGRLETVEKLSEEKTRELVQRIKFLAGMNVLEKRRSQDGHFVYGTEAPVFVRVSSVGVVGKNGSETEESIVIRLLDTKRLPLSLDRLGFNEQQLKKIQEIVANKNGLIIICGPTGAGKSTTAAAVLIDIGRNSSNTKKIISLEDPPEYLIPGVTQIQIDEKISNSFSDSLVHVFRQDPDVLMIGEIRDENSAAVAIRAALTGHLVVATLHTATAAGVILRLENLGVPRKLIVSVLKGVVVQELNNFRGNVNLVADVSVPLKKLGKVSYEHMPEDKLEEFFEHTTNYAELFHETIQILKSNPKPKLLVRSGRKKNMPVAGENAG